MRWFHTPTPPEPKPGQSRVITKFAWFPVRIGNETRWLETVHLHQEYESYYFDEWLDGHEYCWVNKSFAESN
jgi:hypothetical protein